MKRPILFTFALILWCHFPVDGQNLVPNGHFDTYTNCPTSTLQISYATGWETYGGSIEYLHECGTNPAITVPSNSFGFQYATGSESGGYAGFYPAYSAGPNYVYEYFGRELATSLMVGQEYHVSLKMSLADLSNCALDKMGVLFTTIPYSPQNPLQANNAPHVYTTATITDSVNWVTISGSFIADSSYQYIAIGQFFDPSNHTQTVLSGNSCTFPYYYVEDVCVSENPVDCGLATGLTEMAEKESLKIYPNPMRASAVVEIGDLGGMEGELKVYDMQGREVRRMEGIGTERVEFSRDELEAGIYWVQLLVNGEPRVGGRLVIQ